MYQFFLECELVKPVFDYFIKQGYNVRFEVRIGYCIADLVAFKDGKSTAVELKIKDRKKAIIQAKNYQLGADCVYLAFPLDSIYSVLRKSEHFLTCEGIGLFAVNEKTCKVSEILAASCSLKNMGSVTFEEGYRYQRNGFINRF
jgi:hypothetical protein